MTAVNKSVKKKPKLMTPGFGLLKIDFFSPEPNKFLPWLAAFSPARRGHKFIERRNKWFGQTDKVF